MENRVLTYEEIMTMMTANLKGIAELREGFADIKEQQAENTKGFAELRELQKKNEIAAEKRLKKLELLVGNAGKNEGIYAEEFFQNVFAKTLTFAGIKFEKFYPNVKYEKKETSEFDIVLVNGNSVAIIEVKKRIHPKFVKTLATTKLKQFRKHFPEYKDYKVYLGIAGFSFANAVVKEANEYGIGIVRQDGNSVIVNSDFVKEY